ncbi:hypothetical protein PR202_gb27103 [Eleusine coracana subsp. coracana]|uniref:Uncharacterized protein n=1 Tax=Eleusine coracana subsp. coracana TaxID=191504 RepID=A0AAV5FTK0_ELECO|nr:hypothetical protein PR202_gb27103 [Eleusine coracana subsp. coracana]
MLGKIASLVSSTSGKSLNFIITLGAWTIWRHRNDCVFNRAFPSHATALIMAGDETRYWNMAGANDLALVTGAKDLALVTGYGRQTGRG